MKISIIIPIFNVTFGDHHRFFGRLDNGSFYTIGVYKINMTVIKIAVDIHSSDRKQNQCKRGKQDFHAFVEFEKQENRDCR